MGLSENSKYTSTKHFRDRLFERYGVPESNWKQHMARMYGNLNLDKEKTEQHQQLPGAKNRQIYYSAKDKTYVVVDPTTHKLITIFDDPDAFEDAVIGKIKESVEPLTEPEIETPQTIEVAKEVLETPSKIPIEVDIESTDELTTFTEALRKEQDDFNNRLHYRYAQKVIQLNKDIFDKFIHAYQRVVSGNASKINQEHLNTLQATHIELERIFPLLEFAKEMKHD